MSQSTESKSQQSHENEKRPKDEMSQRRIEDHSHGGSCQKSSACGRVNVGDEERIVSTVGGAVLAGCGLLRGGPLGFLLSAIGVGLVYRGATGHCSAYKALDINTNTSHANQ